MRSSVRWALAATALALAAPAGCADPVPVAPPDPGPPAEQGRLTIVNGDPGITRLRITVDGRAHEVTGLKPGEVRVLGAPPARE